MSSKPTCVNCKYYEKSPYHKDRGECRKNPPVIIAGLGTKWPIVKSIHWCGKLIQETK